jgi:hypothetical protein
MMFTLPLRAALIGLCAAAVPQYEAATNRLVQQVLSVRPEIRTFVADYIESEKK